MMQKTNRGAFTAATAAMAGCLLVGCASAPTVSDKSDSSRAALAGDGVSRSPAPSDVRIEAVQRIDSDSGDAVTGIVTVRNVSGAPRTVSLGVTWIALPDAADGAGSGVSRETLTLAPRESRDVIFRGEPGTRDFKVAMSSTAGK